METAQNGGGAGAGSGGVAGNTRPVVSQPATGSGSVWNGITYLARDAKENKQTYSDWTAAFIVVFYVFLVTLYSYGKRSDAVYLATLGALGVAVFFNFWLQNDKLYPATVSTATKAN